MSAGPRETVSLPGLSGRGYPGRVSTYPRTCNCLAWFFVRRHYVPWDRSVDGMIKVIDELTIDGTGKWYRYTGQIIDW